MMGFTVSVTARVKWLWVAKAVAWVSTRLPIPLAWAVALTNMALSIVRIEYRIDGGEWRRYNNNLRFGLED